MSAETAALATTPHPLGKPGGPGLFHDHSLSLPPYVQNIAHSLMTKRGMDKSRAIATAIGVVKNWASGRSNVRPEVRAAATAALADWEAAKAKAHVTPNKGNDVHLSYSSEDGPEVVELSAVGKVFRFRHGWVPVDENGNDLPKPARVPKDIARDNEIRAKAQAAADAGDFQAAIAHLEEGKKITKHASLRNGLTRTAEMYQKMHESKLRGDRLAQFFADEDEEDRLDAQWRQTHNLSQPMTLLRAVLDGTSAINLAVPADITGSSGPKQDKPKSKDKKPKEHPEGKHKLPPGAVGWKHNWVPVDKNGNPVGPSQKDKSSQEIKDMVGHTEATKDAIREAYKNKAAADGKKAAAKAKSGAKKAASKAKSDKRKAETARKHAAAAAKRLAHKKDMAKKREAHLKEMAAKKAAAAKARTDKAKARAHEQLVSAAIKQALADKKAGRPLTPSQVKLLDHYEEQQSERADKLRNDVKLSQPMAAGQTTVPTVSSQDGGRTTVNGLMNKYPKTSLAKAVLKKRRDRKKGC